MLVASKKEYYLKLFRINCDISDGKIFAVNFQQSDSHPVDQIFSGHTKPITSVSVSLDGTRLLSASLDGTAKVWDTTSFQLIRNFTQHSGI